MTFQQYLYSNYLSRCTREPGNFLDELNYVAEDIATKATRPLNVFFSGGIDSEVVVRVLQANKIPFTCTIVEYVNQLDEVLNAADVQYAKDYVANNKITTDIWKLDLYDHCQKWKDDASVEVNMLYPSLVVRWIKSAVYVKNTHPIICGGELVFRNHDALFRSFTFNAPKMCVRDNIEASPLFFNVTPELVYATVKEAAEFTEPFDGDLGHNFKQALYHKYFPDMELRPKYNGFEKFDHSSTIFYRNTKFPQFKTELYGEDIDVLLRNLKYSG